MRIKNFSKVLATLLVAFSLSSCAGEFSVSDALATIASEDEFEVAFCAPLHIGREVLTGENFKDPKRYVERKYGELVRSGLVVAKIGEANSWRILVEVVLTEEGEKMLNRERTEAYQRESGIDDVFFVAVCNLVPEQPATVRDLGDSEVEMDYLIVEREVTPFGEFLGYADGRSHPHSRIFKRGSFSWNLVAME